MGRCQHKKRTDPLRRKPTAPPLSTDSVGPPPFAIPRGAYRLRHLPFVRQTSLKAAGAAHRPPRHQKLGGLAIAGLRPGPPKFPHKNPTSYKKTFDEH